MCTWYAKALCKWPQLVSACAVFKPYSKNTPWNAEKLKQRSFQSWQYTLSFHHFSKPWISVSLTKRELRQEDHPNFSGTAARTHQCSAAALWRPPRAPTFPLCKSYLWKAGGAYPPILAQCFSNWWPFEFKKNTIWHHINITDGILGLPSNNRASNMENLPFIVDFPPFSSGISWFLGHKWLQASFVSASRRSSASSSSNAVMAYVHSLLKKTRKAQNLRLTQLWWKHNEGLFKVKSQIFTRLNVTSSHKQRSVCLRCCPFGSPHLHCAECP